MFQNPRMNQMRTIIKREESYYFVSTNDVPYTGLETMVFPFDLYGGKVTSWVELACDRYDTLEQAVEGHQRMVENFTI